MGPGRVPSGAARPSSARPGGGPEGRALCGGGLPAKVTVSPALSEGGSIYIASMIIWRGWGILGLFVTLAGVFGTLAVVHALLGTSESASALGGGIGFLLAGVANFFLGRWLNIIRPAQNAEDFRNQLRADLMLRTSAISCGPICGSEWPTMPSRWLPVPRSRLPRRRLLSRSSRSWPVRAAMRNGRDVTSTPSSSSPFSGLVRLSASEVSCSPSTRPSPAEQFSRARFQQGGWPALSGLLRCWSEEQGSRPTCCEPMRRIRCGGGAVF